MSRQSKKSLAQLSVVSQLTTEQIHRIAESLNNDRDQRSKYQKMMNEDVTTDGDKNDQE